MYNTRIKNLSVYSIAHQFTLKQNQIFKSTVLLSWLTSNRQSVKYVSRSGNLEMKRNVNSSCYDSQILNEYFQIDGDIQMFSETFYFVITLLIVCYKIFYVTFLTFSIFIEQPKEKKYVSLIEMLDRWRKNVIPDRYDPFYDMIASRFVGNWHLRIIRLRNPNC